MRGKRYAAALGDFGVLGSFGEFLGVLGFRVKDLGFGAFRCRCSAHPRPHRHKVCRGLRTELRRKGL